MFLHATLQPLARLVLPELQAKLGEPDLALSFERLAAPTGTSGD